MTNFGTQLLTALFSTDTIKRYEARHRVLQGLAVRSGLRLYNRNLTWLEDAEYLRAWQTFPQTDNTIHERKFNLFQIARGLANVPGDLAECGVFHGGSSYLMLTATQQTNKHLYGFDSFEGLSEPQREDEVTSDHAFKWNKHDMTFGVDACRKNLQNFDGRFDLYPGWIPERFSEVQDKKFSLVHIDVDLYQPTYDAAAFFYDRLNSGGMLVCDDYGFETCPGARQAMDEIASKAGTHVAHLTTGQGLICKP